jgi:hypothetical protein
LPMPIFLLRHESPLRSGSLVLCILSPSNRHSCKVYPWDSDCRDRVLGR